VDLVISVFIATRCGLEGPESNPCKGDIFRTLHDGSWGPLCLHCEGYGSLPRD